MPWDTEGTKRRLLDAATAEFSAHGLAGARVDRIAANAGVNKERIYEYFGNKEMLFAAVLDRELRDAEDAVPFEGEGIAAVVDYAGRVFDYQVRHPEMARLTFWEGLERAEPVAQEFRAARAAEKVARVCAAEPRLMPSEAEELILTIITLCNGFQALPNVDRLYLPDRARSEHRAAQRRSAIVDAVEATAKAILERSRGRQGTGAPGPMD